MRRKIIAYLAYITLLVIAICITIFLYWLYSPPKMAVDISPNPIPVLTKTVSPNGYVVLNYTYCKNVNTVGRIVISLVSDNVQLIIPVVYERNPRKCESNIKVPIPIPPQATPGEYHFHFRATYQINPLTSIIEDYDTQNFNVTN